MTPRLRKLGLTLHVVSSVGWLGAVCVFVFVAVLGTVSDDDRVVRGVYLVMEPAASAVLLPLAIASWLTGLVQSLGTAWGLLRHYWVVFKLLMNTFAIVVLLLYMETFRAMARTASDPAVTVDAMRDASPIVHSVLALLLLLVATVLGIYKPRGPTGYGRPPVDDE